MFDTPLLGYPQKDNSIKNALDRMEKMGEDPVLPVLTDKPKLAKTLARLDALLKG